MPLKTCQLDIIPTDKLKEVLEGCLPAITHITNSSPDTSSFCEEWKEAIVKPLVKKLSGGLQTSKQSRIHLKSCRESYIRTNHGTWHSE